MKWNICFLVLLAVLNGLCAKTVYKRGLYFGHMITCETRRSFVDYLDYGCFCGVGGTGTPVDTLDTCCYRHDQCYAHLVQTKICRLSLSTYVITYKYHGCSTCAQPNEYSWWDRFGYESVECRKALCDCDAAAARCFKRAHFNDRFKHYDQSKC